MSISSTRPTCSLCQLSISSDKEVTELHPQIKMELKHLFHRDCVNSWLIFNDSCPSCKRTIVPQNANEDVIIARIGTLFDVTINNYPDLLRSRKIIHAISQNDVEDLKKAVDGKAISFTVLILGSNLLSLASEKNKMIEILLQGQSIQNLKEIASFCVQNKHFDLFELLCKSHAVQAVISSEFFLELFSKVLLDDSVPYDSVIRILDALLKAHIFSYAQLTSVVHTTTKYGKHQVLSHLVSKGLVDEDTRLRAVFSTLSTKDNPNKIETLNCLISNHNRNETIFFIKQESQELNLSFLENDPILKAILKENPEISVKTVENFLLALGLGSFFILYYWIVYLESIY